MSVITAAWRCIDLSVAAAAAAAVFLQNEYRMLLKVGSAKDCYSKSYFCATVQLDYRFWCAIATQHVIGVYWCKPLFQTRRIVCKLLQQAGTLY